MAEWVAVGASAPAFQLVADDGTSIRLSALKGKPVILYETHPSELRASWWGRHFRHKRDNPSAQGFA